MGVRFLVRIGVAAGVLAAAPSLTLAQTQPPAPLTLAGAMQRAIEANPMIAVARLAKAVSQAGVGVAGERPNPEVTFDWEKETPRQAITGVFPIELGGKRDRRLDLANAMVATTEASVARLIATIRADVRRAYFASVAADRRLAIAEELRGLATRARDAARVRFAAGDVPELEVVVTELAFAEVENEVSGARGEVAAARAALNALLGQPVGTALTLADDFASGALPTPEAAVAEARAGNSELAVLDRQIIEQEMRRALARSLKMPDLSAGSSLTYDAQPEFTVGWRLSFAVTVPVFTRHTAGVQVEDAELARLRAERQALAARIDAEVVAAVARASAAREQMQRYQTESLPRVVTLERMAQDGYNAGQTDLAVLIGALRQSREIRQKAVQAGLDFQSALAELERAIGIGR